MVRSTCLSEVSDPFDAMVVILLKYLQESNNESRGSEHQDLEVDIDWWSGPHLPVSRTRQLGGAIKCYLRASLDSRDPCKDINVVSRP